MKARRGVSVIEVLVAVTLLGMMATVHTAVTLQFALKNRIAAVGVNRAAAMSNAVDLFSTMPYASLSANAGCTTISVPARYEHQRCLTLSALAANVTRLRIIINPTNTAFRPDTTLLDRAAPLSTGVFQ